MLNYSKLSQALGLGLAIISLLVWRTSDRVGAEATSADVNWMSLAEDVAPFFSAALNCRAAILARAPLEEGLVAELLASRACDEAPL